MSTDSLAQNKQDCISNLALPLELNIGIESSQRLSWRISVFGTLLRVDAVKHKAVGKADLASLRLRLNYILFIYDFRYISLILCFFHLIYLDKTKISRQETFAPVGNKTIVHRFGQERTVAALWRSSVCRESREHAPLWVQQPGPPPSTLLFSE